MFRFKQIQRTFIFIIFITVSLSANATIIDVEYSGTIIDTFGGFPGSSGISLTASFSYETPSPTATTGIFSVPVLSSSLSIEGTTLTGTAAFIMRNDNAGFQDGYQSSFSGLSLALTGIEVLFAGLVYEDTTGSTWNNLVPPEDTSVFLFSPRIFISFKNISTGRSFSVSDPVSTFTITPRSSTPEPTSLVLMSLGLIGLGFSRRKRLQ